ncbi:hypothetical protein BU25DRAFT_444171 [Macroventuria anomochaeta]|uniref:Uncharacterized protein n=1 Tax=Macroventuria anomochaeta TaxID=301207 RepID=A0ACB6SGW7_9PLEO|nr:uncharacterized protein BU25DRAFT_444171 [Macroventuria anomochaeta]KAF2633416.1 hypothetical protein BU25DRAFT_444171 [Macroventuria anomochaeta]
MDRVLAVGETLSCRTVLPRWKVRSCTIGGIPAKVVILDDVVQQSYSGDQRSLLQIYKAQPAEFLRGLTGAIQAKIKACDEKVPVVTGFFSAMPGDLIASVSRGYSDLCAALCAVAVGAEELQIWKEVDGIFTADPRKIKAARLLVTVTSEEAAEQTYYKSEVIHPLTIEQINGAEIPLRLKNVMKPKGGGTIIYLLQRPSTPSSGSDNPIRPLTPVSNTRMAVAKANFMNANGYYGPNHCRRSPTAVTVKGDIGVLNIQSHGITSSQRFLSGVSNILETYSIIADLTTSSQQMLSLAVCAPKVLMLQDATASLGG